MIITQIPVLKLIVEYIDSNLDRICFVLTCKDLFDKRNKILTIKPEVLDHDMQHYFMEFKMKSFLKKTYEQVKALSKISSVDVDVPNVSGRYTGPIRYYQPDFNSEFLTRTHSNSGCSQRLWSDLS
ncbi:hypothetical protein PPL_04942 [Heterostelium album PN500]|uniref:Uncharacterized protein n=1 Tax=Heterostelium pallidum (strain ATCC 26659 / Pp 5 / PN500) TaxID=670386 RepID=D3B8Z8_HETP5|nr:hypothetical protein PPL_04942 [Heterostelium album PN500]EFA82037.1 hypothetical protein PPL_04942 [Heterostelium album PN500]|eukprot:XP_020434154.1 hypothetical protein PPL_04942 [Heterostelium album PN500]